MEIEESAREAAIEVIATLVDIKSTMIEMLLRPAGVPPEVYQPLLRRKDEITGKDISKRKFAPLMLDEMDRRPGVRADGVVKNLLRIASGWERFELAHDRFKAMAAVQRAREVLAAFDLEEARVIKERAYEAEKRKQQMLRDRADLRRRELPRLLLMFDALYAEKDHQKRGILLQQVLAQLLDALQFVTIQSFTRNGGAEQIDGAFRYGNGRYIVECRWREKLADVRQLDGLLGQVQRSGAQTMGVFLSIHGWSNNVVPMLKQNVTKNIVLMDGYDLRTVLTGQIELEHLLDAKLDRLNVYAEPFHSAAAMMGR